MTNKTNYRTPQPDADVAKQLEGIANTVRDTLGIPCEIKGWWIWLDKDVEITSSQANLLKDLSFFQALKGKNAGRYYYKHPLSPKTYYRRGRHKRKSKRTALTNEPPKQKSKRDILLDDIASVKKSMSVDSGENYINLKAMLSKAEKALADFDAPQDVEKSKPATAKQEQGLEKPPSKDDLRAFFGN